MVYDAAREKIVLFGGLSSSFNHIGDTWLWNGTWIQQAPTSSPPARWGHSMAYDSGRHRVILYGGVLQSGQEASDTWEWDGTSWENRPTNATPAARYSHAMAYYPARARTVLFGGIRDGSHLDETWEWDGTEWSRLYPSTIPAARGYFPMTYDSDRDRAVLFGGWNQFASGYRVDDTWEWNGTNWSEGLPATRPAARNSPGLAYHQAALGTILFGGGRADWSTFADAWSWDGTNWSQLELSTSPASRIAPCMAYDAARGKTVLFGGLSVDANWDFHFYTSTWQLGFETSAPGTPPPTGTLSFSRGPYHLLGGPLTVTGTFSEPLSNTPTLHFEGPSAQNFQVPSSVANPNRTQFVFQTDVSPVTGVAGVPYLARIPADQIVDLSGQPATDDVTAPGTLDAALPAVRIALPRPGQHIIQGRPYTVLGIGTTVAGNPVPDSNLIWLGPNREELGRGQSATVTLTSPGSTELHLLAMDTNGVPMEATVAVHVVAAHPAAVILSHEPNFSMIVGQNQPLFAVAFDPDEGLIPKSRLEWSSSSTGSFLSHGGYFPASEAQTIGEQSIVVSAPNLQNATGQAQITGWIQGGLLDPLINPFCVYFDGRICSCNLGGYGAPLTGGSYRISPAMLTYAGNACQFVGGSLHIAGYGADPFRLDLPTSSNPGMRATTDLPPRQLQAWTVCPPDVDWENVGSVSCSYEMVPITPPALPDPNNPPPPPDDDDCPSPGGGAPTPGNPPPPPSGPGCVVSGALCGSAAMGSPVIAKSGELVLSAVDLQVPSRGIPFAFKRAFASFNSALGPMGYNWTHNFSWSLRETADPDGTTKVSVVTDTGFIAWFVRPYYSSTFTPATTAAEHYSLALRPNGEYVVERRVRHARPLAYHFDTERRLTRVHRDPDYDVLLSYNGLQPSKQPKRITDTQGRTYDLAYEELEPGKFLLSSIRENRTGRIIQYRYQPGDPMLTDVEDSSLPSTPLVTSHMYTYGSDEPPIVGPKNHLAIVRSRGGSVLMTASYHPKSGRVTELTEHSVRYQIQYDLVANRYVKTGSNGTVTITTFAPDTGALVAREDPSGAVIRREYGVDGALSATIDGLGNRTIYTHAIDSVLITDPEGNASQREWLSNGPLLQFTDPLGRQANSVYDPRHRLVSISRPGGATTMLQHEDAFDNVSRVTNASGHTIDFSYDSQGNEIQRVYASGATEERTYSPAGMLTTIVDALGHVTRFDFDSAGRIRRTTDADGGTTDFAYDVEGLPWRRTDPLGRTTTLEYDAYSRLRRVLGPDGQPVTAVDLLDEFNTRVETDARGHQTVYHYNPLTRVRSVLHADGTTSEATFDPNARVLRSLDARRHETLFTYDRSSRLTRMTAPDGLVTAWTYDAASQVQEIVEAFGTPLARATTFEYTPRGRLGRMTLADGGYTRFMYDAMDNVVLVGMPLAAGGEASTLYEWDERGALTRIVSPDGGVTRLVRDATGRLIEETVADGTVAARTRLLTYSPAGRLLTEGVSGGSTTQYEYDLAGQTVAKTVAANSPSDAVRTEYERDLYGRIVAVREAVGRPVARTISMTYDPNGNVLSLTNGRGASWRFAYDSRDRMTVQTDPLGRETRLAYDTNGNPVATALPSGATIEREYDVRDRVLRTSYRRANGSVENTVSTTYDLLGRPVLVQDADGQINRQFDVRDRVTEIVQSHLGTTTRLGYDPAGNRSTLSVDRLPGQTLAYGWDAMGRLSSLDLGPGRRVDVTYNLRGQRVQAILGNGTKAIYGYDPEGRIASLEYRSSSNVLLSQHTLTYDARGNVVTTDDVAGRATYVLDALDRLIDVTYADGVREQLTYDAADNWIGRTVTTPVGGSSITSVEVMTVNAADQLVGVQGPGGMSRSLTYILDGALSSAAVESTTPTSYTWSVSGQLNSIRGSNGSTADFAYAPPGTDLWRWNLERSGEAPRRTLHDPDGNLLLELNGENQPTRLYLAGLELDDTFGHVDFMPGTGQPAASAWYERDHLGSVRRVLDASETPLGAQAFGAWGNLRGAGIPQAVTSLGYTGRDGSSEMGMTYLRNRWYDPATGRLLSPDPLGVLGCDGPNLYSYVGNNPSSYTDPTGLAKLIYARNFNSMLLFNRSGELLRVYVAGNWTTKNWGNKNQAGSRAPFPSGTYRVTGTRTSASGTEDYRSMGPERYVIPDIPGGRTNLRVHSGRTDWTHPTDGCIRMNEEDVEDLLDLDLELTIDANDPIDTLEVTDTPTWPGPRINPAMMPRYLIRSPNNSRRYGY